MEITLKIPQGVVEQCLKLGVEENDIPKVYKSYIEETLGAYSHWGIVDGFVEWSEENDVTEYLE
jgi:hypothetical protein